MAGTDHRKCSAIGTLAHGRRRGGPATLGAVLLTLGGPALIALAATPPLAAAPAPANGAAVPRPQAPIPPRTAGADRTPVAFPHPLITEVLFAVPTGEAGDANRDGQRQVAGDEFVELINPHGQAINLRGYTLMNRPSGSAGAPTVRFTFPAMTLDPGQVVVVFNGHDANIPGPVGTARAAPTGRNPNFDEAWVFSMQAPSSRSAFTNSGDWLALHAPGPGLRPGDAVQVVRWGRPEGTPPPAPLIEEAPSNPKGSVTRRTLAGGWVSSEALDAQPFSPGRWIDAERPARPPTPPPTHPPTPTPPSPSIPSTSSTPSPAPPDGVRTPGPTAPEPVQVKEEPLPPPTQLWLRNETGRTLLVDIGTIYRLADVAEGLSVPRPLEADGVLTHTYATGGPSPQHYVRVALADQASQQQAVLRLIPSARLTRLAVRLQAGRLVVESPD
jgi:hypothetical protein